MKNKVSAMIREAAEKNPNEWVYVKDLRVGDTLVHPQPAYKDLEYSEEVGHYIALMGDGEWRSLSLKDYSDCVREVRVVGITLMYVGHRIVTEHGYEQDWEGDVIRIEVEPIFEWDEVTNQEVREEGDKGNGFYWSVIPRYEGDEEDEVLRVRGGRHLL